MHFEHIIISHDYVLGRGMFSRPSVELVTTLEYSDKFAQIVPMFMAKAKL